MKNLFNWSRFARLFKKHTLEHYKTYIMTWVVLVGFLALVLGYQVFSEESEFNAKKQVDTFTFFLLITGSVFTSTIFSQITDQKQGINSLLLPASHFEKYLVRWIYSFVIFLALYFAAFYLVDIVVVNLDDWNGKPVQYLNIFSSKKDTQTVFAGYALIHSIAMVGSIHFRKLAFIKTALIFFVLYFFISVLNKQMLEIMVHKDLISVDLFDKVYFKENVFNLDIDHYVDAPPDVKQQVPVLRVVLALILWLAAYFRLTEKQV